jgi:RNA polymerase sigma-70 factor (ECF subfamily)
MTINLYDPTMILREYGSMVYQLALVQMKNQTDAEDIFQDVFLQLIKVSPAFQSQEHVKAWLIRVTVNRCRSCWRSFLWKKTVPLTEAISATQANTQTDTLPDTGDPSDSDIYEKVLELPHKYRSVLHLYYYEDMPLEQIRLALEISYGTAAKRLSRARELLRNKLGEGGFSYGDSKRLQESRG